MTKLWWGWWWWKHVKRAETSKWVGPWGVVSDIGIGIGIGGCVGAVWNEQ